MCERERDRDRERERESNTNIKGSRKLNKNIFLLFPAWCQL